MKEPQISNPILKDHGVHHYESDGWSCRFRFDHRKTKIEGESKMKDWLINKYNKTGLIAVGVALALIKYYGKMLWKLDELKIDLPFMIECRIMSIKEWTPNKLSDLKFCYRLLCKDGHDDLSTALYNLQEAGESFDMFKDMKPEDFNVTQARFDAMRSELIEDIEDRTAKARLALAVLANMDDGLITERAKT